MTQVEKCIPEKKMIVKGKRNEWYTSYVSGIRKQRDRAKKLASVSQLSSDWKLYRKLRNKYNLNLSKAKKKFFSEKFKESVKSKPMWETVSLLTKYKNKKSEEIKKLSLQNKKQLKLRTLIQ